MLPLIRRERRLCSIPQDRLFLFRSQPEVLLQETKLPGDGCPFNRRIIRIYGDPDPPFPGT